MDRVDNLWEPMLTDDNLDGSIKDVNDNHHWRTHPPTELLYGMGGGTP